MLELAINSLEAVVAEGAMVEKVAVLEITQTTAAEAVDQRVTSTVVHHKQLVAAATAAATRACRKPSASS